MEAKRVDQWQHMDQKRFDRLIDHGCIACKKLSLWRYPEIHHLVEGYRLGDEYTVPLCSYHHRGVPPDIDWDKKMARAWLGPNLRDNKREFIERFGSERELLEEIDLWLGEVKAPEKRGAGQK